jgi:hypothetical protein
LIADEPSKTLQSWRASRTPFREADFFWLLSEPVFFRSSNSLPVTSSPRKEQFSAAIVTLTGWSSSTPTLILANDEISTELNSMATKNDDQPGGKRRQRSRKSDRRAAKGDQPQTAASVSRQDHQQEDQTPPIAALTEVAANDLIEPAETLVNDPAERAEILASPAVEPVEVLANSAAESAEVVESGAARLSEIPLIGEVIPPDAPSTGPGRPTEGFPVAVAAIAMAYGEYARRSFQENRSFVERLTGVRSFEQAIEIQTEFARAAYANFVAESQKICELYGELARQIFRPVGFATMVTQFRRQIS